MEFRLTYGTLEGQPYPWLFVDPRHPGEVCQGRRLSISPSACGAPRGAYVAVSSRGK